MISYQQLYHKLAPNPEEARPAVNDENLSTTLTCTHDQFSLPLRNLARCTFQFAYREPVGRLRACFMSRSFLFYQISFFLLFTLRLLGPSGGCLRRKCDVTAEISPVYLQMIRRWIGIIWPSSCKRRSLPLPQLCGSDDWAYEYDLIWWDMKQVIFIIYTATTKNEHI